MMRLHFQNRITNPSGFLIASSRNVRELSAAAVPMDVPSVADPVTCPDCGQPKGRGFQIIENRFVPQKNAQLPSGAELERANQRDKKKLKLNGLGAASAPLRSAWLRSATAAQTILMGVPDIRFINREIRIEDVACALELRVRLQRQHPLLAPAASPE